MLLAKVLVIRLLLLVGLSVPLLLQNTLGHLVASDCDVPGVQVLMAFVLKTVIVVYVTISIFVHIGRHASLMVTETFDGQILEVWI